MAPELRLAPLWDPCPVPAPRDLLDPRSGAAAQIVVNGAFTGIAYLSTIPERLDRRMILSAPFGFASVELSRARRSSPPHSPIPPVSLFRSYRKPERHRRVRAPPEPGAAAFRVSQLAAQPGLLRRLREFPRPPGTSCLDDRGAGSRPTLQHPGRVRAGAEKSAHGGTCPAPSTCSGTE
jgi:hypothetical protein